MESTDSLANLHSLLMRWLASQDFEAVPAEEWPSQYLQRANGFPSVSVRVVARDGKDEFLFAMTPQSVNGAWLRGRGRAYRVFVFAPDGRWQTVYLIERHGRLVQADFGRSA